MNIQHEERKPEQDAREKAALSASSFAPKSPEHRIKPGSPGLFRNEGIVMKTRSKIIALAVLLCIISLTRASFAQSQKNSQKNSDSVLDMLAAGEIGASLGNMASSVITAAVDIAQQKAEFNRAIETARQRYWQAYPNGPGFREAQKNFAEALRKKDIYYALLT